MGTIMYLMKHMMIGLPGPWRIWLGMLMFINMIIPFLFIHTIEAQIVILTAICGMMIMMPIFKAKGFIRLLGVGHFPWIPMLVWLWGRVPSLSFNSFFEYWIFMLLIINSISLIIDIIDVLRYLKGERMPYITLT